MPWTVKDVDAHKKGLSARQKRVWVRVANSALRACLAREGTQSTCEASAIRQANATAGRVSPTANSRPSRVLTTIAVHTGFAIRYEVLEDKPYLVAPVVPLLEGVLNEYLIPLEEIAAVVQSWQGVPVPINHPTNQYGDHISANAPAVLEQCIGRFFHPRLDGSRLIGEVWIDIDKCERLGEEALECLRRLEAGESLECSTAFWSETTMEPGVFNTTPYIGVHRQVRPDHLALLPHGVGACSIADGCGVRACQAAGRCSCEEGASMADEDALKPGKLRSALRTLFAFANGAEDTPFEEDADAKEKETPETQEALVTQLTHEDILLALYAALGEALKRDNAPYYGLDICDIEGATVIYREGPQFYRRAYTVGEKNTVTLAGEPEVVQRVTTYVPTAAAPVELETETIRRKGDYTMKTKPELVQALIAHEHTAWKEDQEPVLQTLEERVLEQLLVEADQRGEEAPLTLHTLKTFLTEALAAQAQAFDQKLATFAQQSEERVEREAIVGYLVTHQGWKQDEASVLPLTALRNIHRMADPVSYMGQGMPRFGNGSMEEQLPSDSPKWD